MAYTNPFHIAEGLQFDFTVEAADTDNDAFLGINSSGQLTSFATVPGSRITGTGNLQEVTSSVLTITGTVGALLGDVFIRVLQAGPSQDGYLSSDDWNTFNAAVGDTLNSAQLLVGSVTNVATAQTITGDVTINNTGVTFISAGVIVNADVSATASIAFTKMEAFLEVDLITATNGSGFVTTVAGFTTTIAGYLTNISDDVQAQLNSKDTHIVAIDTSAIVQAPTIVEDGYSIIWDNTNSQWDLGPSGTLGGTTGSSDNRILRADGTGGFTIQSSSLGIDDSGNFVDTNANELIKFTTIASAINEVTITNAAIGNGPSIAATGDDINIPLTISSKGTSAILIPSKMAFSGVTLTDGANLLSIAATQPTVITATQSAISVNITSAGSSSFTNQAVEINYLAGYTGSSPTRAIAVSNALAGTASTIVPGAGSNTTLGNSGVIVVSSGTTTGANIGVRGAASNGDINIGLIGLSQVAKNSATNIGVVGTAINTGTTPVQIGGWFSLNRTTVPTTSAALIANNGAQTDAIFLAQDAGTTVFSIADGGAVTATLSIDIGGNSTAPGILRIYENTVNGTNFTAFTVGNQIANVTYTLPTAAAASNGYLLSSTTAGVMSWVPQGLSGLTIGRILVATSATTAGDYSGLTYDPLSGPFGVFTSGFMSMFYLGTNSMFIGPTVGNLTATGANSTVIGSQAGTDLTSGVANTLYGTLAGGNITSGSNNVLIGSGAGGSATAGTVMSGNVGIGTNSLFTVSGDNNIAIGFQAGELITSGSANVIIGYDIDAQSNTASNQLSIQNILFGSANSSTGTTISTGNIGIGAATWGTSAARVVALGNGTPPTTSPANLIQYYSESGILKYRDSSGNVITV